VIREKVAAVILSHCHKILLVGLKKSKGNLTNIVFWDVIPCNFIVKNIMLPSSGQNILPQRCKHYVLLVCWYPNTRLHSVTSQKTIILKFAAYITSNLIQFEWLVPQYRLKTGFLRYTCTHGRTEYLFSKYETKRQQVRKTSLENSLTFVQLS
jgi:hypothetical protein